MRPVPVQQPPFEQPRAVIMLDDAEMTLELNDLAQTTSIRDEKLAPSSPVYLTDFMSELYSAASMIMDREEIAALEAELLELRKKAVAA